MGKTVKRFTSGAIAILLIVVMTLNSLISVNASELQWTGTQKVKIENVKSSDIEIFIEALDENIIFGDMILDLYIRNNASDPVTDGVLSVADSDLLSNVYFETKNDLPNELDITDIATDADAEEVFDSEYSVSNITLAPGEICKIRFHADITAEDLQQLNMEFRFSGLYEDKPVSQERTYKCVVGCSAMLPIIFENENMLSAGDEHYLYLMTKIDSTIFTEDQKNESENFEFDDNGEIVFSDENIATPSDALYAFDDEDVPKAGPEIFDESYMDETEEQIADETSVQESATDEMDDEIDPSKSDAETETDSESVFESEKNTVESTESEEITEKESMEDETELSTGADISETELITESEETTEGIVEETEEEKQNGIDTVLDTLLEDENDLYEEDSDDNVFDYVSAAKTLSYKISGVAFENANAIFVGELSNKDYLTSMLDFKIAEDTEPGLYFANIEETIKIEDQKYELTQGFHFYVTDDSDIVLTGKTEDGGTVSVKGPRDSFPDGDILSLAVSEIPDDIMPDVQIAMEEMAEKNGVSVNKMRAIDIKIISDGDVCELNGPVDVTFKRLEMEAVDSEDSETDTMLPEFNNTGLNEFVLPEHFSNPVATFDIPGIENQETTVFEINPSDTSEPEITYDEDGNKIVNPDAINQAIDDYISTLKPEAGAEADAETDNSSADFAVWHYDPDSGIDEMESQNDENGNVVMTTDHFSIFIVVEIPSGSKINVTIQHWSNMNVIGKSVTDNWASPWTSTITDNIFDNKSLSIYTHKEKLQIYTSDTYELPNRLNADISKMSKVARTGNYAISEVWVINNYDKLSAAKKKAAETADWTGLTKGTDYQVYTSSNIVLNSNSLVRIWYTENADQTYKNNTTLYDHNIYDGKAYKSSSFGSDYILTYKLANMYQKNSTYGNLNGKNQGINQDKFLTGTGSLVIGAGQSVSGNKSTWQANKWTGKLNGVSKSYNLNAGNTTIGPGMIHGLIDVDATKKSNTLKYVSGIKAPDFFAENTYNLDGTTAYASKQFNYKMQFNRVGDTYTLAKILDDSGAPATGDLTKFYAWSGNASRSDDKKIFSNEFWPLDTVDAYPGMDPMCGAYKNSWLSENDFAAQTKSGEVKTVKNINGAHNWHFGMKYEFDFTIGDYTGPLRYYFRGDDDYYVFLDDELVIDNGGIVGNIKGQSVDLRKWLSGDATEVARAGGAAPSAALKNAYASDKDHVYHIKIYTMERGGFGSCCYFTFQLPLVNNYTPPAGDKGSTSVSVNKIWNDYDNPLRPKTIDVVLKQDGIEYKTITLDAANKWSYTWTNLPEKDVNNNTYVYTVEEVDVPSGYSSKITGNAKTGFAITNSLSPEVKVKVTKIWNDNENECGERKDIVFRLYADGVKFGEDKVLSKDSSELLFEHLPKYSPVYSGGMIVAYSEIEYTVDELNGSKVMKVGDTISGKHGSSSEHLYKLTDKHTVSLTSAEKAENIVEHFEFVNTHTHQLQISKTWSDGNENHTEIIYVGLYAYGSPVAGSYLQLSNTNGYFGIFSGLDPGKEYTVKELSVTTGSADFMINGTKYAGLDESGYYNGEYIVSYDETIAECKSSIEITNTVDRPYVIKKVTKVWDDNDNFFKKRPNSIKVQLYQDGKAYGEPKEMTQQNGIWPELSWMNLPKYKITVSNGIYSRTEYKYTVKEVMDFAGHEYYASAYAPADTSESETVTITNSLKTAKVRVAKWIDNWNESLDHNDLLEDDFIIKVSGKDVETEQVLKHAGNGNVLVEDKLSGYIIVPVTDLGVELDVTEISVPKEYTFTGLTETTDLYEPSQKKLTGNKILLKPGDDKIIIVHNEFGHIDYFHSDDRAMNSFGGSGTDPIAETGWDNTNFIGLIKTKSSTREQPLGEDDCIFKRKV